MENYIDDTKKSLAIKATFRLIKSNIDFYIVFYALIVFIDILNSNIANFIEVIVKIYIYIYFLNLTHKIILKEEVQWYKYKKVENKIIFEIFASIIAIYALIEILSIPFSLIAALIFHKSYESMASNSLYIEFVCLSLYILFLYYIMCVTTIIIAFKSSYLNSLVSGLSLSRRLKKFILLPFAGYFFYFLLGKINLPVLAMSFIDGLIALVNLITCITILNCFNLKHKNKTSDQQI